MVASDNLNENYTTVVIHVKDVNDNPPVFDRPTYEAQITEEDDRNLPKRILQVLKPLQTEEKSMIQSLSLFSLAIFELFSSCCISWPASILNSLCSLVPLFWVIYSLKKLVFKFLFFIADHILP